ncbi:MAG: hypothetical protein Q8O68_00545 [Candidatus Daviesbacteria bacterium]|nr:hypothetical protein [Candidatus Daviesbacteria bacterium]
MAEGSKLSRDILLTGAAIIFIGGAGYYLYKKLISPLFTSLVSSDCETGQIVDVRSSIVNVDEVQVDVDVRNTCADKGGDYRVELLGCDGVVREQIPNIAFQNIAPNGLFTFGLGSSGSIFSIEELGNCFGINLIAQGGGIVDSRRNIPLGVGAATGRIESIISRLVSNDEIDVTVVVRNTGDNQADFQVKLRDCAGNDPGLSTNSSVQPIAPGSTSNFSINSRNDGTWNFPELNGCFRIELYWQVDLNDEVLLETSGNQLIESDGRFVGNPVVRVIDSIGNDEVEATGIVTNVGSFGGLFRVQLLDSGLGIVLTSTPFMVQPGENVNFRITTDGVGSDVTDFGGTVYVSLIEEERNRQGIREDLAGPFSLNCCYPSNDPASPVGGGYLVFGGDFASCVEDLFPFDNVLHAQIIFRNRCDCDAVFRFELRDANTNLLINFIERTVNKRTSVCVDLDSQGYIPGFDSLNGEYKIVIVNRDLNNSREYVLPIDNQVCPANLANFQCP